MFKRASLYLRRKYKRSVLLLILLLVLTVGLAVGLSMWGSVNAAAQDVERRLGTSFVVRMRDQFPTDTTVTAHLKDGGAVQRGVIPRPDQAVTDAIMQQVDGTTAYHAEEFTYVYSDTLELVQGGWGMEYQDRMAALAEDPAGEKAVPVH